MTVPVLAGSMRIGTSTLYPPCTTVTTVVPVPNGVNSPSVVIAARAELAT